MAYQRVNYAAVKALVEAAYRAGFRGDDLRMAVAIALAESGGNPSAVGDTRLQNATWGPSVGAWQIRTLKKETGKGSIRDIRFLTSGAGSVSALDRQAYAAFQLYKARKAKGGTGFEDWSVYKKGTYKRYYFDPTLGTMVRHHEQQQKVGVLLGKSKPEEERTGKRLARGSKKALEEQARAVGKTPEQLLADAGRAGATVGLSQDQKRRVVEQAKKRNPRLALLLSSARTVDEQYGLLLMSKEAGTVPLEPPVKSPYVGNMAKSGAVTLGALNYIQTARPESLPYLEDVQKAAALTGVPWQILWAVADASSGWDTRAEGGLMGYDPSMHGEEDLRGVPPQLHPKLRRSPSFGIRQAANALRRYYDKYKDWTLALLAYKFGEAYVDRLLAGNVTDREVNQGDLWMAKLGARSGGILEVLGFQEPLLSVAEWKGADSPGGAGGQGGAGFQTAIRPDPQSVRDSVVSAFRNMYLRDPSEEEIARFSGLVYQALDSYDAQRAATAVSGPVTNPVPGGSYSDTFGAPRSGGRTHQGTDIFAPKGSPVLAPVAGVVTKVVDHDDGTLGGIRIWIRGDDGNFYYLAHLDSVTGVKVGDRVTAGQQVGTVGNTGNAKGLSPHLHFEIRAGSMTGPPVNPYSVLQRAGTPEEVGGGPEFAPPTTEGTIQQAMRGTPEYQRLYRGKPSGMSEEEYSRRFITAASSYGATGLREARLGMEAGSESAAVGAVAHGRLTENPSMRERLYLTTDLFNKLL